MRNLLLTGFEPFGNDANNSSEDIVRALDGVTLSDDVIIRSEVLPVVRDLAAKRVTNLCEAIKPHFVIMLGQTRKRTAITPEKIAINLDDFCIPDNDGNQPIGACVVDNGPDGYFTDFPIKAMVEQIKKAGVAAEISYSAGTFVCNHLFYGVAHHIRSNKLPIRAGFIHVPLLPQQDPEAQSHISQSTMTLAEMVEGIKAACEAAVEYREDLKIVCGVVD